ncbi:MAG TPA: ATP-binding protein [Gemmatimonadales bacterium]|nr:ATP-binding protein [Gemmatimonadales bacterium]
MIALDRTRAELLAEIDAPNRPTERVNDLTDRRVARGDVQVRLSGHGRDDLFPLLEVALSDRFVPVSRIELLPDLLIPLRNALGNAWKHGNGGDSDKTVAVEMVLTGEGALIAITDEGPGFDVAATYQRYREEEAYYQNHGCGFRNFDCAVSTVVSFENEGRTILLRYRPAADPIRASSLRFALHNHEDPSSSRIVEELSVLPEFVNGGSGAVSCAAYAISPDAGGSGHRYAVRVAHSDNGTVETRIVTGRLHAAEECARADLGGAAALHDAGFAVRMRIPRPLARLTSDPRLVLFDFDPWMNLWEYLGCRRRPRSVRHFAERVAQTLSALHKSRVTVPEAERDVNETLERAIAEAETAVRDVIGAGFVDRFHDCVQEGGAPSASRRQRPRCPIHGALAWDCIHFGIDGKFYLYRFEKCRRSDPGFDLGGFAADLTCFTLARFDAAAYRLCRDAFLAHYNAQAEHPVSAEDLRLYTALALCERLRGAPLDRNGGNRHLVTALDVVLRDG